MGEEEAKLPIDLLVTDSVSPNEVCDPDSVWVDFIRISKHLFPEVNEEVVSRELTRMK